MQTASVRIRNGLVAALSVGLFSCANGGQPQERLPVLGNLTPIDDVADIGTAGDNDSGALDVGTWLAGFWPDPCLEDDDCFDARCDSQRGICVACLSDPDCPTAQYCSDDACRPICSEAIACPDDMTCLSGHCQWAAPTCRAQQPCPPEMICDLATGQCRMCRTAVDCAPAQYCGDDGRCLSDVCPGGWTYCVDGAMRSCALDGSGWEAPQPCPDNACTAGRCDSDCKPECTGRQCGSNGCGGFCGQCQADKHCEVGRCVSGCLPNCSGRLCGSDGCAGSCGTCDTGDRCNADGRCEPGPCEPNCADRQCGADGCTGTCGTCPSTSECIDGWCRPVVCQPACASRQCGPDGCGNRCGTCPAGRSCNDGQCAAATCPDSDLGMQLGQPAAAGTTTGASDLGLPCGSEGGAPEMAFQWTAPWEGTYLFDTIGSGFDTVLYLYDGSCSGPLLQCNDDMFQVQSQVSQWVYAGQQLVIVVDGYGSSAGDYLLNIVFQTCHPNCNGRQCGSDGCNGTCGDCPYDMYCDDWGFCQSYPCDCDQSWTCDAAWWCSSEPCECDLDCQYSHPCVSDGMCDPNCPRNGDIDCWGLADDGANCCNYDSWCNEQCFNDPDCCYFDDWCNEQCFDDPDCCDVDGWCDEYCQGDDPDCCIWDDWCNESCDGKDPDCCLFDYQCNAACDSDPDCNSHPCSDILNCFFDICPNVLTSTCQDACVALGHEEARRQILDLLTCGMQFCGYPTDMECFQIVWQEECNWAYRECSW